MNTPIHKLLSTIKIKSFDTFRWNIRDSMSTSTSIEKTSHYNPGADIRLYTQRLAYLELLNMTPRSENYAVKYQWFGECLKPENNRDLKVESKQQLDE